VAKITVQILKPSVIFTKLSNTLF